MIRGLELLWRLDYFEPQPRMLDIVNAFSATITDANKTQVLYCFSW